MSFSRIVRIAALCASLVALPALAAVPTTSLVEGTLSSTGGGPAADGVYQVTFNLYKDNQAAAPYWTEGPVAVTVKSGAFAYQLGSNAPIDVAALGQGAWLSMKVGADPELSRKPVNASLFALRAAVAESIDPALLAAYPKKTDLAGVALSGNYADLSGAPNLSAYVKSSQLATVASTGKFSDLTGFPAACGTGLGPSRHGAVTPGSGGVGGRDEPSVQSRHHVGQRGSALRRTDPAATR